MSSEQSRPTPLRVARVYLRVSTDAQDLKRQEEIITTAKDAGYYVAGVYREKASGARVDRPELLRMIADLQPSEVVIAERIDRISRLPLPEAEKLIASIEEKGARLAIPGVVDLTDLAEQAEGVAKVVLESVQTMLLRLALQMARDDIRIGVNGSDKVFSWQEKRVNIVVDKQTRNNMHRLLHYEPLATVSNRHRS